MRIYTDTLTPNDIRICAPMGTYVDRCTQSRSRKRERVYDVILSGNNSRNVFNQSGVKAATWDEWGYFLAAIYEQDSQAICGPYADREEFHQTTKYKFDAESAAPIGKA